MARIRTVKPDFFRHEGLQDLEAANVGKYVMLVFEGLWTQCDKAGRFEWKPRMLKLDILPFLPFDMAETLTVLKEAGYIRRYSVGGKEFGVIDTFEEHQRINGKEAQEPAKYPIPPEKQQGSNREATETTGREGKGREKEGNGEKQSADKPPPFDPLSIDLPENVPADAWREWVTFRRKIKKPLQEESWRGQVANLDRWAAQGFSPHSVIKHSIDNGYQGLFEPKKGINGNGHGRHEHMQRVADELTGRGRHDPRTIEGESVQVD